MPATVLSPETRNLVLESHPEDRHCLVCYDVLSYATKTPCQHDEICGVCHLRIRFLHSDKKCPICKTENEQVIVDENKDAETHNKHFQDYPIWGDDLGADFVCREDVGMFFRREYYEPEIQPLFGYHCTVPNCTYDGTTPDKNIYEADSSSKPRPTPTPIRGLQDHLRVKHRLALCQLCVDHQRDFVARLPRFTPAKLKQHLSKGDGKGSGFEGHPVCEFCRPKRFYDLNYLHQHLNKEHYKCHVCEQQGLANQFFKNYKSLEKHFDTLHFLCHDVQCVQARFVVFANELDLRHHERQVHGGTSTGSSKIQLEFRVRRPASSSEEVPSESDFNYNLDGQAFVPENLPQTAGNASGATTSVSSSDVALHPLHVQRTALLREQAAEWREANSSVEAFPSLAAANESTEGSNSPLRVGWASGTTISRVGRQPDVGAVTEEAFPALGPSESSRSKKPTSGASAKLQANRQFSAMRTAASAPTTTSWGGSRSSLLPQTVTPFITANSGSIAATNQQRNLTADNFPSLGTGSSGDAPQPYAAANNFFRHQQRAPSLNSTSDFPPPPAASQKTTARDRMVGDSRVGTASLNANILQGPSPSLSAKVTVADMKATLGKAKYKELKRVTAEFAGGSLESQAYVDIAASLFDRGYADTDFWKFLPALLADCPNKYGAKQALQYMENLKRMKNAASNAENARASLQPSGPAPGWKSRPAIRPSPAPAPSGGWMANTPVVSAPPIVRPGRGGSKMNAWGSTSPAVVTRANPVQPALSVASAAAKAAPSEPSAQSANTNKNGKKKKGKQKNELRELAFGK